MFDYFFLKKSSKFDVIKSFNNIAKTTNVGKYSSNFKNENNFLLSTFDVLIVSFNKFQIACSFKKFPNKNWHFAICFRDMLQVKTKIKFKIKLKILGYFLEFFVIC